MELEIYPLLSRNSQSAMKRRFKGFGRIYRYTPRPALIERLSKQLNRPESEMIQQINRERDYLTGKVQYFN